MTGVARLQSQFVKFAESLDQVNGLHDMLMGLEKMFIFASGEYTEP